MMYDLKEKIVLISGGASGIGFSCAKEILRAGARAVAIADINEANGKAAAEQLIKEFGTEKVLFVKTDVTNKSHFEEAFKRTLEKWKNIDVLINNAGTFNDSQYELEIAVNATSVVHGTLLGLQYIGKDKGGKGGVIVNIASQFGVDGDTSFPIYSATKSFVIGLSRSVGTPYYYDRTGVKIVTVCPGLTNTPLTHHSSLTETKFLFPDLRQRFMDRSKSVINQPTESVALGVITSITNGENGSVWIAEDNEHYEIDLPNRKALRK
ncbi:hypothetical protein ILUMI_24058 [Ignelater luminosus]|uniref:Alcohol dehydrogenase n=1 Tax=Ignelater luminosus TaxID=2038154 RepID=A0A8K0G119_IGNLU|nr:hypothetical protein ILUMI_24058 [Ignelater luminosus]